MADYGLRVFGSAGAIQIDQNYSNVVQQSGIQADTITATGDNGDVYYFGSPTPRAGNGEAALIVYKADGTVAFDSRNNVCRVVTTLSGNIGPSPNGTGTFTYTAGRKYATIRLRSAGYSQPVAISGSPGAYYWTWDYYWLQISVSGTQVTVSQTVEHDHESFGPGPLPPARGNMYWRIAVIDVTGYTKNTVDPGYRPIANVAASPSSVSGSINSSTTGTATSSPVTISWTGGTSGSTKVTWVKQSGDTFTPPSGASGSFSTSAAPGTSYSAVYRAYVSDTKSSGYVDVPVTLSNTWTNTLAVTVSPSSASYTGTTDVAGTYTLGTSNVTATGSGGSGSYTFTWAMLSGSDPRITINNPSSAVTGFKANLTVNRTVGPDSASGTARCTVHDGVSTATFDVPVHIAMNWTGPIN